MIFAFAPMLLLTVFSQITGNVLDLFVYACWALLIWASEYCYGCSTQQLVVYHSAYVFHQNALKEKGIRRSGVSEVVQQPPTTKASRVSTLCFIVDCLSAQIWL